MQKIKNALAPTKLEEIARSLAGGFLSVIVLAYLTQLTPYTWLMAPFGASCVLLFAVPSSPLAQPKNLIIGHFVTALIGLSFMHWFGTSILTMACALGLAIASMQLLQVIHPPAGANPLLIMLAGNQAIGFEFLLSPILFGSLALMVIAFIVNNAGRGKN